MTSVTTAVSGHSFALFPSPLTGSIQRRRRPMLAILVFCLHLAAVLPLSSVAPTCGQSCAEFATATPTTCCSVGVSTTALAAEASDAMVGRDASSYTLAHAIPMSAHGRGLASAAPSAKASKSPTSRPSSSKSKSSGPSRTKSPTSAPSKTSRPSSSSSKSSGPSRTKSSTSAPSKTSGPSHTKAVSSTPSRTKSKTGAPSTTKTASGPPSRSKTNSPPPSRTRTHSITPSVTRPKSVTPSRSRTPSAKPSSTAAASRSRSKSPSAAAGSMSRSASATSRATPTCSKSHTASRTVTSSATARRSVTASATQSSTSKASRTASTSMSVMPSGGYSTSPSRTESRTPSTTRSTSKSNRPLNTFWPSESVTASESASEVASQPDNFEPTGSDTAGDTATPSVTSGSDAGVARSASGMSTVAAAGLGLGFFLAAGLCVCGALFIWSVRKKQLGSSAAAAVVSVPEPAQSSAKPASGSTSAGQSVLLPQVIATGISESDYDLVYTQALAGVRAGMKLNTPQSPTVLRRGVITNTVDDGNAYSTDGSTEGGTRSGRRAQPRRQRAAGMHTVTRTGAVRTKHRHLKRRALHLRQVGATETAREMHLNQRLVNSGIVGGPPLIPNPDLVQVDSDAFAAVVGQQGSDDTDVTVPKAGQIMSLAVDQPGASDAARAVTVCNPADETTPPLHLEAPASVGAESKTSGVARISPLIQSEATIGLSAGASGEVSAGFQYVFIPDDFHDFQLQGPPSAQPTTSAADGLVGSRVSMPGSMVPQLVHVPVGARPVPLRPSRIISALAPRHTVAQTTAGLPVPSSSSIRLPLFEEAHPRMQAMLPMQAGRHASTSHPASALTPISSPSSVPEVPGTVRANPIILPSEVDAQLQAGHSASQHGFHRLHHAPRSKRFKQPEGREAFLHQPTPSESAVAGASELVTNADEDVWMGADSDGLPLDGSAWSGALPTSKKGRSIARIPSTRRRKPLGAASGSFNAELQEQYVKRGLQIQELSNKIGSLLSAVTAPQQTSKSLPD